MPSFARRLRTRSPHPSAWRAWEQACAEANGAYARWSADPSDEHYRDFLAADARASRARQLVRQREGVPRRADSARPA